MGSPTQLCLSTFQTNPESAPEDTTGTDSSGHHHHADVAHTAVVASSVEDADSSACDSTKDSAVPGSSSGPQSKAQTEQYAIDSHALIRTALQSAGFSARSVSIIDDSWRDGTKRQYRTYIEQWRLFCVQRATDPFSPHISEVINFLTLLFDEQTENGDNIRGFSALNTARSALSSIISIDGLPVGQHPMVKRFMKGVFNIRPALPRYNVTWDVNTVLKYLKTLSPVSQIPIKMLSHKLVMLMSLVAGQRGQSLHLCDVRNLHLTHSKATFIIGDLTKTSRPGHHIKPLIFKAYAPDRRLCVHTVLKAYLERTLDSRGSEKRLLLTLKKPFHGASRDTIGRWIKDCLSAAGIDMTIFAPHSVRSASVSKAKVSNIPIDTILRTAGWSSDAVFTKYYNKPIQVDNYAEAILN